MTDNLQVESIFLYPKENAKAHKTDLFELIHDEVSPVPILRRGLKFTLAIRFANRRLDETNDQIRLLFNFGTPKSNISYLLIFKKQKIF